MDAIERDPNYALAHAHLAHCHEILFTHHGFDDANKSAALRHAHVVVTSGTDDATALAVAAFAIIVLSKDHDAAFAAIERALSLNRSCATALYFAALMYSFAGRPADAISNANRALRLSPFDPAIFQAPMALGFAALHEARYNEAASHFAKAVQANPRMSYLYFLQADALALAGRLEEARSIARRGLELFPGYRTGLHAAFGLAACRT